MRMIWTGALLGLMVSVLLAGCMPVTLRDAPDTSNYRGLRRLPPTDPGDCWVLGRDNTWRRCAIGSYSRERVTWYGGGRHLIVAHY